MFGCCYRYLKLWNRCVALGLPETTIRVAKNGTRMSAKHSLLVSILNKGPAIMEYHTAETCQTGIEPFQMSTEIMQSFKEIEAVLALSAFSCTLSQYEESFNGAFPAVLKGELMIRLKADELDIVDFVETTKNNCLPRIKIEVSNLTAAGKICRDRAILEGEG